MNTLVRRTRAFAAALLAAVALTLVPAAPSQAIGPGSIQVTVTESGSPSAFASVTLQGPDFRFGSTDPSGVALFSDLALGDYTVVVAASGAFQETTVTVGLTAETPAWAGPVERQPWPAGTGSISLTVLDHASSAPVAGAHVTLNRVDGPGPALDGVTDGAGVFLAEGLVAGRYVVAADATPDHLGASSEIVLADAEAAATTIRVLAADAVIQGRVVDPDGAGVGGIFVSAELAGPEFFGSVVGFTDPDGYYVLDDAAAGTWQVGVNADANWERATVTVPVEAGATAQAPDIELTPRVSGTISGLVASADGIPESSTGGFFDVCVTVLRPDGVPVPGASLVTGGDSFYFFWLAPGEYTAFFEDCDPAREPHGYEPVYLGGSETLAGATIVTVETLVDTWLDTTTLAPRLAEPEPTHDAVPVRTRDLDDADRDRIDAPSMLRRGETATVTVGVDHAGEWVSVWLHSRPTLLGGWQRVSETGTVQIEIPRLHPLGVHELVVQDSDDAVIGWTDLRVRARVTCLFPWLPDCA